MELAIPVTSGCIGGGSMQFGPECLDPTTWHDEHIAAGSAGREEHCLSTAVESVGLPRPHDGGRHFVNAEAKEDRR